MLNRVTYSEVRKGDHYLLKQNRNTAGPVFHLLLQWDSAHDGLLTVTSSSLGPAGDCGPEQDV